MNRLVTTPEDEPGESTVVACDAAPPEEVLVLERGKDLGHAVECALVANIDDEDDLCRILVEPCPKTAHEDVRVLAIDRDDNGRRRPIQVDGRSVPSRQEPAAQPDRPGDQAHEPEGTEV